MELIRERSPVRNKAAQFEGPFFYPLHCVWAKTNKQVYSCEFGELAYEASGSVYVVAGNPRAKSLDHQVETYKAFVGEAHANGKSVCGYYFSEEFALSSGQVAHRCGVSRLQPLRGYSLEGGDKEEARRALSKVSQAGHQIIRLDEQTLKSLRPQLDMLIGEWKAGKGFVQIKFLLSEAETSLENMLRGNEEVFVCIDSQKKEALALISMRRYFGSSHWYVDSLIQKPGAYRFALDACLVEAQSWLKSSKKAEVLSLGFCPGIIENPTSWVEKVLTWWKKTKLLYSPKGLYVFKRKYSELETPRYLLVDPEKNSFQQLLAMELVTLFLRRRGG